ncbi:hypothetical protein H2200_009928 [Cladophialophora chaetospira]|uniref:Uncharacterized protein n=1 Tax=Cladophialophora chaetospira TaxID=386627 RepID=A0AA39CEG0_9EURO|nr:hypothetical protein H2200_009928 [Cladophialophora chaetospira]
MASYLYGRDVVSDAKDTFSSWDKCMDKTYCKWPVIVAIVIGSLILLSVLFCVIHCCKGGGSRDRPSKHKDDYTRMPPTPYQGYQPAPSPMAYGANPSGPQFATFDDPSSKRLINEDSLPPMPSWENATKRRVEDTSAPADFKNEDLEMGRLDSQPRMRGGYDGVPNPALSPHQGGPPEYFHNTTGVSPAYNSDLGDQRLLSHNEHDNFQTVPLNRPPTYRSNSTAPSAASDRFIAGAISPSPNEYNRGGQHQPQHQPSYQDSYAPSSTRYEPSHDGYNSDYNRLSMPKPFNPAPTPQSHYTPPAAAPYEGRPPSFLQVGRKPVNGSFREV